MNHLFRCSIFLFALLTLSANSLFASSSPEEPFYPSEEDVQDFNFKRHYLSPCEDILEYGGYEWKGLFSPILEDFFREKSSRPLSGIAGRYKLQDSTLYLTGLDICFYAQVDDDNPAKKHRTKVPLKILFPGAKKQVAASFFSDFTVFSCLNCKTNKKDTILTNMYVSFLRGKISHQMFKAHSPINPITKKPFSERVENPNGEIWYQDQSKEEDLAVDDLHRIGPKDDPDKLDTIQFKDLMDSLSPYYQKHLKKHQNFRKKMRKKLDALDRLISKRRNEELWKFSIENPADNVSNDYNKTRRLYEFFKYNGTPGFPKPTLDYFEEKYKFTADSVHYTGLEECLKNKDCLIFIEAPKYPSPMDIQDSNFKQHHLSPCEDILEYGNSKWEGKFSPALMDYFREKNSRPLSGIAGRYKLQDSTLFLTGLDICFYSQDDSYNSIKKFRTRIPLDFLFPGAKDSVEASFFSDYTIYSCLNCLTDKNDSSYVLMYLSVLHGKILHMRFSSDSPIDPIPERKALADGNVHDNVSEKEDPAWEKAQALHLDSKPALPEYVDTIQFKDLIDSLSPYYQKHRRNYLDSLAKEKEKQSSEKRKDGQ